ncbi:MAG TPA: hypothetical protein ENI06_04240 [Spirochaetales bacterium]|nr:hypothetical protein [Spirochaetales bacterium]
MVFENICRIPGISGTFEVRFKNGRIENLIPIRNKDHDAETLMLTSGLFDIQFNGMLGYDLSAEGLTVDQVIEINSALERRGILRWCPTICSQTSEIVEQNLSIIREAIDGGLAANIHCIHLEGHYISSEEGYRGVHLPRFIRDPDPKEFDRWSRSFLTSDQWLCHIDSQTT